MPTKAPEHIALEYAQLQAEYWEQDNWGVPMSVHERYRRAFDHMRGVVRNVRTGRSLGQLLVEMELISERELEDALQVQQDEGCARLLGEVLVDRGALQPKDLCLVVARQLQLGT